MAPMLVDTDDRLTLLWSLEQAAWTSGREGARAKTAVGAITIFPYPAGILQGDAIWSHPQADTGWRSVEMTDRSAHICGPVAVLAYRVSAEKPDVAIYRALCASTWLNDEGVWTRLSHQHTPVA